MAKQNPTLTFDEPEIEALRGIVQDWLEEEVVTPPFAPEVNSILEKLNLPTSDD